MAGGGRKFLEAGYAFPKALIDINGKTMIELVIKNLRPKVPHKFIFICPREHYEKFDLHNILKKSTGDMFEVVLLNGKTEGAACTVLSAIEHINTDNEILIANSDQYIEIDINKFLKDARTGGKDGLIMTFDSSHPKWSYARVDKKGKVLEVAEKKVISDHATAGLYYFKKGNDFVRGAEAMIHKNIRHNNEFYVCPVYNELILGGKNIRVHKIAVAKMNGLGTPEDVAAFQKKVDAKKIKI